MSGAARSTPVGVYMRRTPCCKASVLCAWLVAWRQDSLAVSNCAPGPQSAPSRNAFNRSPTARMRPRIERDLDGSTDLDHFKIFLARSAFRTDKVFRHVIPRRARNDSVLLEALSFIVYPPTDDALPLAHWKTGKLDRDRGKAWKMISESTRLQGRRKRSQDSLRPVKHWEANNALTTTAQHLRAVAELMRFDRPVGWLLLIWPTLASLFLSIGEIPPLWLVAVFALGAITMRTAGCVANDLADRKFDPKVERTRNRPLADGRIGAPEALAWLALLLTIALLLVLTLDRSTQLLAVPGLMIALAYPFFKRWTHFPQLVLGAAFSWGVLMAGTATAGTVPTQTWMLFGGSIAWIVAYDTQYAMVDREDDLKIGVKSTAILFGNFDVWAVSILQFAALALWSSLFFVAHFLRWVYALTMVVVAAMFLHQFLLVRSREVERCFRAFKSNARVGFALFAGVCLDTVV